MTTTTEIAATAIGLSAPEIPAPTAGMTSTEIRAAIGSGDPDLAAPLARSEDAWKQARAVVRALIASRRGGSEWRAAMDADARDQAAGTPPKTWRLHALLADDPRKWSEAVASCKALPLIEQQALAELDRNAIAEAADKATRKRASMWAKHTLTAWETREDKHTARGHYDHALSELAGWNLAGRVAFWSQGGAALPSGHRHGEVKDTDVPAPWTLPDDLQARGAYLLLGVILNGSRWLRLPLFPHEVLWPDDLSEPNLAKLIDTAMVGASTYTGIRSRGVAEVSR